MGLTQGDAECQGHVAELQALLGYLQLGQQYHQLVAQPKLSLPVPCCHGQGQRPILLTQVMGQTFSCRGRPRPRPLREPQMCPGSFPRPLSSHYLYSVLPT